MVADDREQLEEVGARAVAVVGASDRPGSLGRLPIEFLPRYGYRGRVLPVRPDGAPVAGLPAYRSLADCPGPVDLAMVMVAADRVPQVVDDAAQVTHGGTIQPVEPPLELRHPLALRRERGELLVRTGDHLGGAAELEAWAEVVESADPEAAEAARRSARLAREAGLYVGAARVEP